ncbi:Hha/YmoA family nucleoid-associated regulatory protein [Kluyvera intermedia]|uniref:Hha/YmoA family nucleoid-associated regulatory protein n=1 Tax=Kluyvera intermedia TaxID=61648 RepID=UPI00372D7DF4
MSSGRFKRNFKCSLLLPKIISWSAGYLVQTEASPLIETTMTRNDWLLKFRRHHTLDTLEKVYEHLSYTSTSSDSSEMTLAYDHRKAELVTGKLFDRVPKHVWQLVK